MNNQTIKFSRDVVIESSYDVAKIKLNNYNHAVGQPVLVRYYNGQGRVNSILAVGILDGIGPEHYTIISNGEIEPVSCVYNTRWPDSSVLVNDEVYVCYDDEDKPAYCFLENNTKTFTPIVGDKTFYSAKDGFHWFVSAGKIRRADSPIDSEILASIIQELLDNGNITTTIPDKKFYEWIERPDGIVSDGSPYARVFDIPYGKSVVMAVLAEGPFGNNYADIITYGSGSGTSGYNLTTKTKSFMVAKDGNQPKGVVHTSMDNRGMYSTKYRFVVLASTCDEDEITWYHGTGWRGKVYDFTGLGSEGSIDDYVTLNYSSLGKANANLSTSNGFIVNAEECKDKVLTTTITNVPAANNSYKFVVNSNISGFVVKEGTTEIANIDQNLYSGSIVTLTKADNDWLVSVTGSDSISSDGSITITTTENGQKDFTVSSGSKEFIWIKESGLSTFTSGTAQYSWIRVLNIQQSNSLIQQGTLTNLEFKCKSLGISGILSVDLAGNLVKSESSHEFYKAISENFEFAVEASAGGGYYFYVRPKYPTTLKSFEIKTLSCGAKWAYASDNYSVDNTNPYYIKNSALTSATLSSTTTSEVIEGSDKLITSGALFDKLKDIEAGDNSDLEDRIEELEENSIKTIVLNNETYTPTEGEVNLGTLYGSDNTTVLNSDTVIDGVLVKRGSLVRINNLGNPVEALTLSSNSVFHKVVANTLAWWSLGSSNSLSAIRVTVSNSKMTTVSGNIWWTRSGKPVTDNATLAGYIKFNSGILYIKGSSVFPFTVEIEDYTGSFTLTGTAVPGTSQIYTTLGVTRSDSSINVVNLNKPTNPGITSAAPADLYVVSGGTNPVITISTVNSNCFTFDVLFKDSQSKSLVVKVGSSYNLNLTNITVSPGVVYTVTYKQDELIYTVKTDSLSPLTVSDLGVTVEAISNRVESITEDSTNNEYPTAKAVWNIFKGKYTQDFFKVSEYDSSTKYPYQAALKVTTPAIMDVYWTTSGGTFSDTLYVNGKKGSPGTYNIRCHNQLGVFSLRYYGGDFYVCIPALASSTSEPITYNFVMSSIGKASTVDKKFFNSAVESIFVGQSLEFVGSKIYNLDTTTSITNFNFEEYDTILATVTSGNTISIVGNPLPSDDKIYSFINNTGRDLSSLYFEGTNSSGLISKINIANVQSGAIVTLAYVAETNTFEYSISLQSFISPNQTIDIKKGTDQWKFDIADDILEKINNPVTVNSVLSEGTKIATINDTDIFVSPSIGNATLTVTPTQTVGGVKAGVTLTEKTALEILEQMLTPYVAPSISSIQVNPSVMLYGKSYSGVTVTSVGKKGTKAIASYSLDGSSYTDFTTLTKTKNLGSMTQLNGSVSNSGYYSATITDIDGTSDTKSTTISYIGGVFIFYSLQSDIPAGTKLDFSTYNCQSERTSIKGFYEDISHSDREYLYIIAPNTKDMEIKTIKSGSGYTVPMNDPIVRTLKQGEGDNFVNVEMRIYRSVDKHKPGVFSCEINNPTV